MKVCKECKHYKRPSIFNVIFTPGCMFNEKCNHENAKNKVDGTPTPCITMRAFKCGEEARLYEAKGEGK